VDQPDEFPSLLPVAKKIVAQTLAQHLVGVAPPGGVTSDMVAEVRSINRERKIEAVIEDKPYEEMRVEDHPDYKLLPSGRIFYLDYSYGNLSAPRPDTDPQGPVGRSGPRNRALEKWKKALKDIEDGDQGTR